MNTTQHQIAQLINKFDFEKPAKSFKEQLLNDEAFRLLAGYYGKYQKLRDVIESELINTFGNNEYSRTAIATIKMGGLILDVKYNGMVTIQ